jgi:energy-coupling factor transport system substrate-specific component
MTTVQARLPRRPGRLAAIKLRPRAAVALGLVSVLGLAAFFWPFFMPEVTERASGGALSHSTDAPWLFVALLPLLLAIVIAEIADGGIDAKAIAMLGVLAACGAALRPLGAGATGVQPIFFLLIPAGRVLGRGFGFVLGALTLFASALLTAGVGPWLPFQMIGAGWVGFLAGCLPRAQGRAEIWLLAVYGVVAGLAYGALLNLWFWPFSLDGSTSDPGLAFVPGDSVLDNLQRFLAFDAATSLGFDIPRAATNFLLVLFAGRPVLNALRRAARKAAFDAPVEFEERR